MRLTVRDILKLKHDGTPIAMVTAYDATSARLAEAAGFPMLLVGDSLGMVVQGHDLPIPVTLDHMVYHASIVSRVTTAPLIVGDLPFMTYSVSPEQALTNAARLMQEGGVSAVKLEGGEPFAPTIARLVTAGIPVMAHVGLMPQSVHKVGGLRVQGRDLEAARQLVRDAEKVEAAGAFAVVVESVPAPLAKLVTERLSIPTIGIGAGPDCDGQVQVFHDLLGLFEGFVPRHTRQYAQLGQAAQAALAQYRAEVERREFPTAEHSFTMKDDVLAALRAELSPRD
ncbi:MAG TPA: 3-methyl-2-oxobutanoate hydroxymethyltransferase [Candidatus Limnocylindrales bacterium]|nr:3-methyl-2-oxobutanoate hydroxymethyltransferase [Candidatus Limnocylindrales bacterium]